MIWKKSVLSVLLFFLLYLPLLSLSSEEKALLPDLSKEELIEIILIYDQTLTGIEEETTLQELIWKQKELDLSEREKAYNKGQSRLEESEAALIVREQLLAESFEIQKRMNQNKFWTGFLFGNISGGVAGSLVSGLIVNRLNN